MTLNNSNCFVSVILVEFNFFFVIKRYNSRSVEIKSPSKTSCCGIGAIGAVGKLANLIRLIVCISLVATTVLLLLIASGIFADFLVSSKIL